MLEEKLDTLTKEVVALRQAIEKNGTGGAAPAANAKPKAAADDDDDAPKKAPAKKAPAKKKAVEPDHDQDEVGSIFRKAAKIDKPKCKKYLGKVDCEDLAELLTKPELYDAAYDFAEAIIEAYEEEEEEDGEEEEEDDD
jgi:hypothetical protein